MKKISLYILALGLASTILTGCDDNWATPPVDVPTEGADVEATISIADFKALYWENTNSYTSEITTLSDGSPVIIKGTVSSSTESGNIYKQVYIQDATGGLCISVDTSAIYSVLPMGVGVAVDLTGLYTGRYSGVFQVGANGSPGPARIAYKYLKPHVFIDYYSSALDTVEVTIPELNEAIRTTEGLIKWQGQLVRINNVCFKEAGMTFSDGGSYPTSRTIADESGASITCYNSSYADFAYDRMPDGYGDLVGILSSYGTTWRLLLIDSKSIIGFSGEGADGEPVEPEVISVSEAISLIRDGYTGTAVVQGMITKVTYFDESRGSMTYYIKDLDPANGSEELEIYSGLGLNGAKFNSKDDLQVGAIVTVRGPLQDYNGQAEMSYTNWILEYIIPE